MTHACPFYSDKRHDFMCIKFSCQHYREECPYEGDVDNCPCMKEEEELL